MQAAMHSKLPELFFAGIDFSNKNAHFRYSKSIPHGFFKRCLVLLFSLAFSATGSFAQNETTKWYFGNMAGLDFMTSPPTILTNGAMNTSEGCSSVADASGNLLFYTNGVTIYDASHAPMANGTGLAGNVSTSQSGVIVKQPGNSSIYFVFSLEAIGPNGLQDQDHGQVRRTAA